jgi:hypothetical protein
MTSEGQSSTNTINNTSASSALDGSTLINTSSTDLDDDFGDMDMNDEMYHALENMEANALRNGNNSDDFDEFMDDDWDPDLLESVLPPTIPSSNSNNNTTSHTIYKRRAVIDSDDPEEGPSTLSQTPPEKKRQKIKSVRADQLEDLMWGEDEDENVMELDNSATNQKDEIQVVEDNKDERWSLDKLNTILKKMEKDEPVGSLPDTVIINGTIKRLGQLRVTTTQGFYLVGYLRNPMNENDDRLRILFRNKVYRKDGCIFYVI